ncbi:MAG: LapA family protein [Syntrophomonadaceae bacterium]|nr:LapA family protein [Syntrophomonadaceae bacterium]MDD3024588.1 LapA family protein [Syntrophomonadaceae bacterium]
MQVYIFTAILFLLGIGVFIFQNTAVVAVRFLTWVTPEVSLALVILAAACGGALITFLLDSVRYFKIAKKIKDLGNLNKRLQDEIDLLKKKNWKLEEKFNSEKITDENNEAEI